MARQCSQGPAGEKMIRVLVVDDSALMRKLIPHILTQDPQIEVVATAMDGLFALKKIQEVRPDVITLDVDMPRMDGLTALPHIVREYHIPVLVVSSLTEQGAQMTFKALEMGAVDFLTKPKDAISVHIGEIGEELIRKVKAIAAVSRRKLQPRPQPSPPVVREKRPIPLGPAPTHVVAIGISTGGPSALSEILPQVPADFPAGILLVQHMPEGFTEMFAARLNQICRVEVKQARDGDLVLPGRVLIAPGNHHLKVKKMRRGAIAVLSQGPPVSGHRPSADVLFRSVAEEYGAEAIGVIMSGMGEDGAEEIGRMKAAGSLTIAQDEESSVIFGMPRAAIKRGHIDRVLPLHDIVPTLRSVLADAPSGEESALMTRPARLEEAI